jgi:hypothetical protein
MRSRIRILPVVRPKQQPCFPRRSSSALRARALIGSHLTRSIGRRPAPGCAGDPIIHRAAAPPRGLPTRRTTDYNRVLEIEVSRWEGDPGPLAKGHAASACDNCAHVRAS